MWVLRSLDAVEFPCTTRARAKLARSSASMPFYFFSNTRLDDESIMIVQVQPRRKHVCKAKVRAGWLHYFV